MVNLSKSFMFHIYLSSYTNHTMNHKLRNVELLLGMEELIKESVMLEEELNALKNDSVSKERPPLLMCLIDSDFTT